MNKKYLKIVTLLAFIGLLLSAFLIHQHYSFKEGLNHSPFCSINQWIDCKQVATSPYASVAGVPVAAFALHFYLILLIYALFALFSKTEKKRGGIFFCFYLMMAALLVTLGMAYLSLVKLKVLCLFCSGLYLVNGALILLFPTAIGLSFATILPTTREYVKATFGRPHSLGFAPKTGFHLFFVLLIFTAGFFVFFQIGQDIQQKIVTAPKTGPNGEPVQEVTLDQVVDMHFAQPQVEMNPGNRPYWGNKAAKVVLVEFSDFECPFCKHAAEFLKPTLSEYKEDIVLYYVNYPLDQSCNKQMQHPLHQRSCAAALSAICAGEQGKFWPYHDLLFENQADLGEEALTARAAKLGLNLPSFAACRQAPQTMQILQKDLALGKTASVQGTPTVFINGRHLGPWSVPELLKAIVEEEINKN